MGSDSAGIEQTKPLYKHFVTKDTDKLKYFIVIELAN